MQSRDSASNASSHETLSSSFERPKCQRLVITHNAKTPQDLPNIIELKDIIFNRIIQSEKTGCHYHPFSIMIHHSSMFGCIPQCDSMGLLSLYQIDKRIQKVWLVWHHLQISEFMRGTTTAGHGLPRPNGGVATLDASADPRYIVVVGNV